MKNVAGLNPSQIITVARGKKKKIVPGQAEVSFCIFYLFPNICASA